MTVKEEVDFIMELLNCHPTLKEPILEILKNPERIDERLETLRKELE